MFGLYRTEEVRAQRLELGSEVRDAGLERLAFGAAFAGARFWGRGNEGRWCVRGNVLGLGE